MLKQMNQSRTYRIRCRRAPSPKHVRPIFPVLEGIKGRNRTTCSDMSQVSLLNSIVQKTIYPLHSRARGHPRKQCTEVVANKQPQFTYTV